MNENNMLEVTWEWFKFHANQRYNGFNYFLIIIGAIAFAYYNCMNVGSGNVCAWKLLAGFVLGCLGLLTSFAFFCLEIRNVELVNIGRKSLMKKGFVPVLIDNAIKIEGLDIPKIFKKKSDEYKRDKNEAINEAMGGKCCLLRCFIKHEVLFRMTYLTTAVISSVALLYSIYRAWQLGKVQDMFNRFGVWVVIFLLVMFVLYGVGVRLWHREDI